MHISIIIPVHHGGDSFKQCLGRAMACLDTQSEVIVVADGLSDGAWQEAQKYDVSLITLPESLGAARARNIGAKQARGELLFFVDADVLLPLDALNTIRAVFAAFPDISALIGSYDDQPAQTNFLSQYKNLFHHYVHQQAKEQASTFWGACGAIKASAFWAVGGFDEQYRGATIEDIDLGFRLRQQRYKIRLVKDLQVKHLKHWGLRSLLRAEIFSRAVPWTRLILESRVLINDLNLTVRNRVSLVLAYLMLSAIPGALFWPWYALPAGLAAGVFLVLNRGLYIFFIKKRGLAFCLPAILWHWLYFVYSGLGFALGFFQVRFKTPLHSANPNPKTQ